MRGFDTQVIGVQTYLRAMQGLSNHLSSAESQKDLDIVIGVLLLLAYLEVSQRYPRLPYFTDLAIVLSRKHPCGIATWKGSRVLFRILENYQVFSESNRFNPLQPTGVLTNSPINTPIPVLGDFF